MPLYPQELTQAIPEDPKAILQGSSVSSLFQSIWSCPVCLSELYNLQVYRSALFLILDLSIYGNFILLNHTSLPCMGGVTNPGRIGRRRTRRSPVTFLCSAKKWESGRLSGEKPQIPHTVHSNLSHRYSFFERQSLSTRFVPALN